MAVGGVSGTEQVIFSTGDADQIRGVLDRYAQTRLGSGLADVIFRAGRIDAVWAVTLGDHRSVLIKAHRQPADLAARLATVQAQRVLADAGFPAPRPLCDTTEFEGLVLTTEELVTAGSRGDGRVPAVRRSLAEGLASHVAILRTMPEIGAAAGPGPAWCRYQDGPWPEPHDSIFDFTDTPPGFEWLDEYAAEAASRLREADPQHRAVGHADWYVGNARFSDGALVGTFDWDLVAAPEPHIAGFAAAAFTDGGTDVQDLPRPEEVLDFLVNYDSARESPFDPAEQRQAAAATAWTLAYNARCQLSFLDGEPPPGTALRLLADSRDAYLDLRW
ncbi:phosphotransferase [Planctomonas deserti]|uniref:phosphotransferase n=1 Tax=Planctomonas deserti TaxID=2144185 RepID=UPI000D360EA9|nr:phosphotransferase [Planctomonas deserti]